MLTQRSIFPLRFLLPVRSDSQLTMAAMISLLVGFSCIKSWKTFSTHCRVLSLDEARSYSICELAGSVIWSSFPWKVMNGIFILCISVWVRFCSDVIFGRNAAPGPHHARRVGQIIHLHLELRMGKLDVFRRFRDRKGR